MLFDFFSRKKREIKAGDCALMKKEYKSIFPSIPTTLALKIIDIDNSSATVRYCNLSGTDICEEKVLLDALIKVN